MSDFGLDLRTIEDMIDEEGRDNSGGGSGGGGRVILEVLDGTTDPEEWIELVATGNILVLDIAGDLEELAAEFAPAIRSEGGEVVHFRSFLIVTPPGVEVSTNRL